MTDAIREAKYLSYCCALDAVAIITAIVALLLCALQRPFGWAGNACNAKVASFAGKCCSNATISSVWSQMDEHGIGCCNVKWGTCSKFMKYLCAIRRCFYKKHSPSHWLMSVETIYLAKYTVKYLRKIWLASLAKAIKLMRYPCNASGLNLKLVVKKKVCVLHVAKYGKRSTFQNTLKVILLLTCTKV